MKKSIWGLVGILSLAAIMRFGGLNWCLPYNPHPDEWNMAHAVTQLTGEEKLNPHFFAYGQFPLYLTYFTAKLYNLVPWIHLAKIETSEAIFFLRFWSAVAGISAVFLVYLISKRFLTTNYSLLATTLAAFTPGLIQISHFGTTESLLSFFFLLVLLFSFKILENPKIKYFLLVGVALGLAIGTKISALIFGFPFFLTFVIFAIIKFKKRADFLKLFGKYLLALALALTLTVISSPYLVLAFKDSQGTLLYETSVSTGKSPVFYTRQFINTTSVIFQLKKIFPYALGWPIFILGAAGLVFSISFLFRKSKNLSLITNYQLLITVLAFLTYFLSQAFLFTKWTRFMAPIFAFFPIFASYFLYKISFVLKSKKILNTYFLNLRVNQALLILTSVSIVPGLFFSFIYFTPDIRFTASNWIFKNISTGSQILFDTGNVVDIPINPPNRQPPAPNYPLISFDFYHLDENPELFPKLLNYLEESDYIIIPSRRIFLNHLKFPDKYPLTAKYYNLLFSGKLGFTPIAKIEPFYSKIFKDEMAEETFTVFDHPTIRIYKKTKNYSRSDYEKLFNQ